MGVKIVDLPSDKHNALGGTRRALVNTFNYCRGYVYRLEVFKVTLEFMLKAVDAELDGMKEEIEREKKQAAAKKARDAKLAKAAAEKQANKEKALAAREEQLGDSE